MNKEQIFTWEYRYHDNQHGYGLIKFTLSADPATKTFWVSKGFCPDVMYIYSAAKEMWKETNMHYYMFPVNWMGRHWIALEHGWHLKSHNIETGPSKVPLRIDKWE